MADAATAVPAYEADPYRTTLATDVVATGEHEGRPFAVLADTILFPEGGGQPADHGSIGGVRVVDVQREAGVVRHFLAGPVPPGRAEVVLDWTRRFDHMQQHTGQHLLSAVAEDRFGWATTSFHLGGEVCDVELSAPGLDAAKLVRLEEAVAGEVRAARRVTPRHVTPSEYRALAVRSRGLPPDHQGDVRLVEIEGVDLNTCGGTHLRSTAEIEALCLLDSEPMRGGTRVHFVAGSRARLRLRAHEARNAELRSRLGTPDEGLIGAIEARIEAARDAARREKLLREELAGARAEALAAGPGAVVDAHFEAQDAGFLQIVARRLVELAPGKRALLTAGRAPEAAFVVAAGKDAGTDLRAAGAEIAALLGGRGGGGGAIYQGKATDLTRRAEALARLQGRT